MNKSVVIIDCQVLQTSAWTRGMGRYLTSLIMGINENDDAPTLHLIFNKNLQFSDAHKKVLEKVAPAAKQHFLEFSTELSDNAEKVNAEILDDLIVSQGLEQSLFVMGSVFSFDYQPAFPAKTVNASVFYDMIPLKRWDSFYKYFPEHEYYKRYKFLYQADMVFAISDAVKQDLINILALKPEKVINISGAEIPHFLENKSDKPVAKTPFSGRYLLLPGGNSPHKNMLRAIRGFDIFNAQFGDALKLVITSYYSEENIAIMQDLCPNILITGEVSDDELHHYYKHAELILFPSLDEGLGLPVLEAVAYDRKIACSNIPVFKEVSKDAFYYFDPHSADDIASALLRAYTDQAFSLRLKKYDAIRKQFTWKNSAAHMLNAIHGYSIRTSDEKGEGMKAVIVVEQDGNLPSIEGVAKAMSQYPNAHWTLYIDEAFERSKADSQLPFIFSFFLPHYDISDYPRAAKNRESVLVLTSRSSLSPLLVPLCDHVYGADELLRKALNKAQADFQLDGNESDKLQQALENKLMGSQALRGSGRG